VIVVKKGTKMAKKSGSVLMNFGDFVMNVVVRSGG
jgi:hypothetical protein